MATKREYIGRIAVKLDDGRSLEFSIHKSGRSIWLDDYLIPVNRSYSWGGIDAELGSMHGAAVESRRWLEHTGKPLF